MTGQYVNNLSSDDTKLFQQTNEKWRERAVKMEIQ